MKDGMRTKKISILCKQLRGDIEEWSKNFFGCSLFISRPGCRMN